MSFILEIERMLRFFFNLRRFFGEKIWKRPPKVRWPRLKLWLLSLLFVGGVTLFLLSHGITSLRGHLTIDQILFHLRLPAGSGASSQTVWKMVGGPWVYYLLELIIVGPFLWGLLRYRKLLLPRFRICLIVCTAVFLVGFMDITLNFHVWGYLFRQRMESNIVDQFYYCPKLDEITVSPKTKSRWWSFRRPRNLVLVVAESLEGTFGDERIFPEKLMPDLRRKQRENFYFPRMKQVQGTHYTLASLYGILYGLPLLPAVNEIEDKTEHSLFPDSLSLPEVLAKKGYQVVFLQGGSLEFVGKKHMFDRVPRKNITLLGMEQLQTHPVYRKFVSGHLNDWGLADADLFVIAKRIYQDLQQKSKPFCLIVLTVDTHAGNELDERQRNFYDSYGDMRDVIGLANAQINEFVDFIQERDRNQGTVIAVTGDHGMMQDRVGDEKLSSIPWYTDEEFGENDEEWKPERSIYTCLINPVSWRVKTSLPVHRLCATFDWAPTLLEAVGFMLPNRKFGLGTSLFSPMPTLLEQCGYDTWGWESMKHSLRYERLIYPPQKGKK